jgi:RimJ/RimL family protein N-acetyltransferase
VQFEIRRARAEDAAQLIELNNILWNDTNTPAITEMQEKKADSSSVIENQFVAIVEGKVAGYVGYNFPTPLKSNNHVLEIDIGVHPSFHRRGIGKALCDFISSWGSENGYKKVSIRVLETNEAAIPFYKANGFIEQGRLIDEFYIKGKYVDDILMYRKI